MDDLAIAALRKRVGGRVRVQSAQGRLVSLSLISVDGEGFSCYVLDDPDYDPSLPYWWSFDEILAVCP
ncbi:MAG: hypothetical protein JST11_31185 [Acidobacteria bacterium]|nr:hypothetical protein [Acidobacteriota bacterium]